MSAPSTRPTRDLEEKLRPTLLARWVYRSLSLALLLYGLHGLWHNDLYVPGKYSSNGVHFSGQAARLMFVAIVLFCGALRSAAYDKAKAQAAGETNPRNNMSPRTMAWLALASVFFASAYIQHF